MSKQAKRREEVNAVSGTEIVPSRPGPKQTQRRTGQPEVELVTAELIPSPAMQAETNVKRSQIQKLVQEQVAKILANRDDFVMEPWFRTRQVAHELRRLQTVPERKSWHLVYEWGGCIICKSSELPHAGNGMCTRCRPRIHQLKRSAEKEIMAEAEGRGRPRGGD
jgi:hypothetical protein